jgi:hypothetical protein
MNRLILMFTIALLAVPAAASAKGPSAAEVSGPGTGSGLTFTGGEGDGSALSNLSQQAGFFPAAFGQDPDPMLPARPKGDLGPRYTITYTVPGPNNDTFTIHADVYPYAASGPATYTKPGQPIFDMQTRGGWYQATADLKETLVAGGLPASPVGGGSSDGWPLPSFAVALLGFLVVVGATLVVANRRGARMAGSPS